MLDSEYKWACLKLMSRGHLHPLLLRIDSTECLALLHWLDVSGLALYFLKECKDRSFAERLPPAFVNELEIRAERNRLRIDAQLQELAEVVTCLKANDVSFAIRKGFSLTPEFCTDPYLRHQADLDLVVPTSDLQLAVDALHQLGYRTKNRSEREIAMSAESVGGPPMTGDIYALRERMVEIHSSFYEALEPRPQQTRFVSAELSTRRLAGIDFPALPLHIIATGQLYHAVAHIRGWIRLSWLWELHHFISSRPDESFWSQVAQKVADDPLHQPGVAVVLKLLNRAFDTQLPGCLAAVSSNISSRLSSWTDGACDEFLFRERPNEPSPLYVAVGNARTNATLAGAAISRRLKRPFHYLTKAGDLTLRADLHRTRILLSWYFTGR